MDPSNYRKRVLHKLAVQLGLPKLTFQVIRRTIATLAKDKGHVKGHSGDAAPLAGGHHDRCLHADDGGRSALHGYVDHEELMGTGTTGQHSSETRVRQRVENFSDGEATLKGGFLQVTSPERKKPAITHPVRGKVLEFATKMLPS